ncbi:hypothetical protein AYK24_05460 [Thermoplasmatales archaeon SG8-52-4]|nr:MAG: hypothetical protein AYK24_05460 [Thermoplasmatales archaeon SG8-52-4]
MKMKNHIFLAVLLISIGLIVANTTSSLNLTPKKDNNKEIISALVYLNDQVDLDAISNQMDKQRASLEERHQTTVLELQNTASTSQTHIVEYLTDLQKQEIVKEFQCFWIGNIIRVDTYQSIIDEIAIREDVYKIYPNYEIELIAPVKENTKSEPNNRNDVEPGVVAVRAPEVWEEFDITGEGVLVATIDSGVDGDHPAIASRWAGVADPRYEGHPEWAWFDPYTYQNDFPYDLNGHGTHTMGSVCGGLPGDQIGVAPGALWISAGLIQSQDIPQFVSDAIEAFEWLIDPDGNPETNWDVPDVCSNSWGLFEPLGYPPCDETFWTFIDACESAGIVIIFIAGNEGPAGLRNPADRATDDYRTFSVGAVDANDPDWPIWIWSSEGPTYCTPNGSEAIKPDIAAPGVNVRSSIPGGGYETSSGTSMAAPHVNGVVALMREYNSNISVKAIKEIIYQTAYDLGDPGEDNSYGWGMIDAYEAILNIGQSPTIPELKGPTNGMTGESFEFTLNSTDPDGQDIYYFVDWDDGTLCEWIGPYLSGEEVTVSHIWENPDTYEIRAKAMDSIYFESDWSAPHVITIVSNQPPTKVTINGPAWGFGGTEYEFTFRSTDPDNHNIYYSIDWDDGTSTGYIGPYSSGEQIKLSHSWNLKNKYWIKAWAKDEKDLESQQQANHQINILTDKSLNHNKNLLFEQIIYKFLLNFPSIYYILTK